MAKYKSRAKRAAEAASNMTGVASELDDLLQELGEEPTEKQKTEAVKKAQALVDGLDLMDVESLRDEIENWQSGMEGTNLENTNKYSEVSDAADELSNIETSYSVSEFDDIESVKDDLENAASDLESVQFPSMF